MRMLAYDRLILVTGKDSLVKESYRRLQEIETGGPNEMETVVVDVFDFMDCLKGVERAIDRFDRVGTEVIVNFSGGTKVLSDAALLASFQKGVSSCHCEEELIQMPVVKDLAVEERFTEMQRKVLVRVNGKVENKELEQALVDDGNPLSSVQKAIRELKNMELLDVTLENKKIFVSGNESQLYFKGLLMD